MRGKTSKLKATKMNVTKINLKVTYNSSSNADTDYSGVANFFINRQSALKTFIVSLSINKIACTFNLKRWHFIIQVSKVYPVVDCSQSV